jgi:hypothetical protein
MYCPSSSDKDRGFDRFGGASLKITDEAVLRDYYWVDKDECGTKARSVQNSK